MNRGRPRNSRREELVRIAHLLEAVPAISNLEIAAQLKISRNRVPERRDWLEQKGFVPTKEERRAAVKDRISEIAKNCHDLQSVLSEIRSNYPDLPSSESHVRKILKEAEASVTPEREFNLIRYKKRKIFQPALGKYYKTEKLDNQEWGRLEKDFGDPEIRWERYLRRQERYERRKEEEARTAEYRRHGAIKVRR